LYFLNQPLIGEIPSGIPNFSIYVPSLDELPIILYFSIMLALLGVIDSLLTSIVADNMTNTKHLPNRESVGQGIGNVISGLFGGLAGAGATMRTVVNIKSGGKTPLSGLIHSIVLIMILVFFGNYAAMIPLSILAAILLKVGYDIIDWNFFLSMKKKSIEDKLIVFTVILLIVFSNLIVAIFIGILMFYISQKFLQQQ
jgi:SulP family sulfate permease